ncbi:MAG TPA: leucyl aminopeptidase [Gammaproteobacteria bacterium]
MEFTLNSGSPEKQRGACVVVGVHEKQLLTPSAALLDRAAGGALTRVLARGDLEGKPGQALLLHDVPGCASERVLLLGCGPQDGTDDSGYRKLLGKLAESLGGAGVRRAASYLVEVPVKSRDAAWKTRCAVETVSAALYRFDQLKSKPENHRPRLQRLGLQLQARGERAAATRALAVGKAVAAGVALARDLGNLPGNVCTPSHLAERAQQLAAGRRAVRTRVLNQAQMEKLGMGALLSVTRGSRQPPKFIVVEYRGGKPGAAPHVLVGKGITFDSGGISIKPAATMDEMKYDMCGAASVLGALTACIELGLPLNVIGLVPSCENLPDGNASKPGDIVTSLSGQTVEVLNTDAEGRLILCDALTYAERYKPAAVIDVATLTGACVIALGSQAAGLFGNDAGLVQQLLAAGQASGDRAWELPLWEEYQEQLKSNFADMANVGGREAGAITAASFLARFTRKYHWAHLDIAGVAWRGGRDKGGTGRPVPLLVQYLLDRAGA